MNPFERMNAAEMRREQTRRAVNVILATVLVATICALAAYGPHIAARALAQVETCPE